MSVEILELLRKYAPVGQPLKLMLDSEPVIGVLIEINVIGVVLQTANSIRVIKGSKIDDFEAFGDAAVAEPVAAVGSNHPAEKALAVPAAIAPTDKFEQAFKRFDTLVELPKLRVDFSVLKPHVSQDDYRELNKFSNSYEYALRIKEYGRIRTKLPDLTRLVNRIQNPDLFFICGLINMEVDLPDPARQYLLGAAIEQHGLYCLVAIGRTAGKLAGSDGFFGAGVY